MNIHDILHELKQQHGNNWHVAALSRYTILTFRQAIDPADNEQEQERALLLLWLTEILAAGVAFRQESVL